MNHDIELRLKLKFKFKNQNIKFKNLKTETQNSRLRSSNTVQTVQQFKKRKIKKFFPKIQN